MTPVAIAHDVLGSRAGGERVMVALADAFPDAPIHTLLHEPTATFDSFDERRVETSWLHRSAWLRDNYRLTMPVAGLTFSANKIDAAVTICSTSGVSHHARTTGAKVVYCHTPARWLHDPGEYMRGYGRRARIAAGLLRPAFSRIDRVAMRGADLVLANSARVAHEIGQVYGIDAAVVHPCSTLQIYGPTKPLAGIEPGFVLTPARPLGYKRLDVLAQAARALPSRTFVHIGDGPHREALIDSAPNNFISVGAVDDNRLRWAYANASVVALTCAEDYGLVPLEAAAFGVHTVAPAARGLLDHRADMLTTYDFASVGGLVDAIKSAPSPTGNFSPARLGTDRFIREMREIVESVT